MAQKSTSECEETPSIVIDHGSHSMKSGFGGHDSPKSVLPTVVASPKMERRITFVGDMALKYKTENPIALKLNYPIVDNQVKDWGNMTEIYRYICRRKLNICAKHYAMLMIDNVFYPRTHRGKMAEILFEEFDCSYVCFINQSVAALLANGMKSGIVIDSGNTTSIVPVYEGVVQRDNIHKVDIAGNDLIWRMNKLLRKQRIFLKDYGDIISKLCYVAKDFEGEMKKDDDYFEKVYKLPDGREITINKERFLCPEVLFKPDLIGKKCDSLDKVLRKCIDGCSDNMRKDLLQNIVLCGGNTMFMMLVERLYKELGLVPKTYKSKHLVDGFYRNLNQDALCKDVQDLTWKYCDDYITGKYRWMYDGDNRVQIHERPERKILAWIGGSIYSQTDDFKQNRVSKQQYEEHGAQIFSKKSVFV